MLLLSGSAHPELANQIANRLQIDLCPTRSFKFKNGETNVEIEWSVRGSDVYVIQVRSNYRLYFRQKYFFVEDIILIEF